MNRSLTEPELQLVRWMLERGKPDAADYLAQLAEASVTPWRCPCGCASLNFAIHGRSTPKGCLRVLADFVFGSTLDQSGIFVYEQEGLLSGLEVYGLSGEAPKSLPTIESLRCWESSGRA